MNGFISSTGPAILDVVEISNNAASENNIRLVKIHRSKLRQDMLELFNHDDILQCNVDVTYIGYNGQEEIGRGAGVLRDALTSFWKGFCNALSVGAQSKVPAIRHDYQKKEWAAVARILLFGFMKEHYFPLVLSPAFIAACLFGEDGVSDDYLLKSFYKYIGEEEREALKKCMSDDFDSTDEDVLDFLSSYKCYKHVTKENINEIIHQLAHQELIQRPKYIMHCWSPYLKILLQFDDFKSVEALENFYNQKKPTPKKLIKLIDANPSNDAERSCLDHLKRYIKSLQCTLLETFLQFITGSDILLCDSITVSFSDLLSDPVQSGKGRRPIAHTCGPVLELPSTYQSYNELSEEFTELLNNKDSWEYNIV